MVIRGCNASHDLWGEVDAVWLSETGVVPMESADEAGGAQQKTWPEGHWKWCRGGTTDDYPKIAAATAALVAVVIILFFSI